MHWRGTIVIRSVIVGALTALLVIGFLSAQKSPISYATPEEADPYVRFAMEAFDQISEKYWIKPGSFAQFNSPELPQLFQLALAKGGVSATLATSTRAGTAALIADALKNATSTEVKKKLVTDTVSLVLYNLIPYGRNALYSEQQVTQLRNEVANVNPEKDLYKNLGVEKGASETEIQKAYTEKAATLAASSSSAAKEELKAVDYAHKVLSSAPQKQLYDTAQVEPSVFSHTLGRTLYVSFNKISPTTLQEFGWAVLAASTTPGLDSLILDMRGNVGGSLDFAPAFVGLFIGANQYAFDLYHQGENDPQRTTLGQFPELSRYREVAVLTDPMTQSTAETTTAVLKRLRLAHVVGERTRGWGSVENTYPLKTEIDPATTYALFLVNSLTLRDDQQPIEQNGVLPDVDTSASGWQRKLSNYFSSPSLISALTARAAAPPLR
ncbi:MAG: S41 family peptidase [Patescibacteria group bacterium]